MSNINLAYIRNIPIFLKKSLPNIIYKSLRRSQLEILSHYIKHF